MKRLFLACVGVAALTGAAAAADLYRPAPAPYYKAPAYVPAYTWSGFYLGVNGGGGWGRSAWDSTDGFDTSGGLVGGTIGYNYQIGQAVVGIEGDIDWADINGTTTAGPFCHSAARPATHWLSTVRGRLGYAADRFMPYITGGAAFGDIHATTPGLRRQHHDQCRLDRRRRARIRHRRPLDGQGRISLRRPRQFQLRHRLRRLCDRQRVVPHQPRARRHQLPVLIAARSRQDKPRGSCSGVVVCR